MRRGSGYALGLGERHQVVPVTLCFVLARGRGEVLLSRTAPDKDRFAGLWNGVGGHVEPGEDIRAAARREVREETGLVPESLELCAVIHETGLLGRAHLLFVFRAELTETQPARAGREGTLAWFALDHIPWERVVPDLRALLPRVLEPGPLLFGVQEFDGGDGSLRLELG